jgi:adenosylcobinamide-GDP ribazoletransferase
MRALAEALRFLSVIPVPGRPPKRAWTVLAAYPLAGLALGLIASAAGWASGWLFGAPGMAVVIVTARILITGGLHMDGLADLADGAGGGRDRERRLAIMADSRLGSWGALSLLIVFSLQTAVLAALLRDGGALPEGRAVPPAVSAFYPVLLASALTRGILIPVMRIFPSARPGGMGDRSRSAATKTAVIVSLALSAAAAFLLYGIPGLAVGLVAAGGMMLFASVVNRRLKGLTGDVYGALLETGDLMVFTALLVAGRLDLLL